MLDLDFIKNSTQEFKDALLNRKALGREVGDTPEHIASTICALESSIRTLQTEMQKHQTESNELAKIIAEQSRSGGVVSNNLRAQGESLRTEINRLQAEISTLKENLRSLLATIPNIPMEDVPVGEDENDNKEIRKVGTHRSFDFIPKEHDTIGLNLGFMDFATAASMSGARFVVLKKDLALMERALANFMLNLHTKEFGYTEVSTPVLVREQSMFNTGQLPKFRDDQYNIEGEDLWLIPTGEVPLTNLVAGSLLDINELPLRYTAYTPCFRAESGAAGRDTRGIVRMHQFSKVELVSIVSPEKSDEEHERMLGAAEEVLKRLNLPYRVVLLCTGDMGFTSRKTYDIEVWMPGRNKYMEISSCSNCGDFQARRMNARYKGENTRGFVHTLNGSGLAIGRTIAAILENYQTDSGTVIIPDALIPYMDGVKEITAPAA